MKKKFLCVLLAVSMVSAAFTGCGNKNKETNSGNAGANTEGAKVTEAAKDSEEAKKIGYSFGYNQTFYSEEPVTYSMYFSDASWYPLTEEWKTEGVFAKIKELTNVTLDLTPIDSGDYNEKTKLAINGGDSCYIIPKVYDESAFVDGGAVVAVSDWVKYMPNYQHFYDTYNMKPDVDTIIRSDGKYYRLPGMNETAIQDYTLLLRDDLFKAAGYDVSTLEQNWTWDDLYNILVDVKAYMVSQGMCKESDYIWSDLWCGGESGQGNGGNLLKIIGASYGVPSGWAVANAITFDAAKDEWYFASTTEDYKAFITMVNKFIKGGILDPETFTQDDATANNKFYRGETALISINKGQLNTWLQGLDEGVGAGNYETYYCVYPKGSNVYTAENQRLENGVMIASKALKELGEEDFIKLMRFVDWLWYSDEAYDLIKWGVEGEHYTNVTDETTGKQVKQLTDHWFCGGLGIPQTSDDQEDLRLKYGYAGGNFWYGHSLEKYSDNFNETIKDYVQRVQQYRELKPINPSLAPTEDENEQINLWKTPLIDNVNAWTLQFATGQKDIEANWDEYVNSCKNLNCEKLVKLYNEIYQRTK